MFVSGAYVLHLTMVCFFLGKIDELYVVRSKNLKQFVLVVRRWSNESLLGFLAMIKN